MKKRLENNNNNLENPLNIKILKNWIKLRLQFFGLNNIKKNCAKKNFRLKSQRKSVGTALTFYKILFIYIRAFII